MGVNLGILNDDETLIERSLAQIEQGKKTDEILARLRDTPKAELRQNVERALKTMTAI